MSRETPIIRSLLSDVLPMLFPGGKFRREQCGRVKSSGGGWMQLAPDGTPDIAGHDGQGIAVYVETKMPDGKLSVAQCVFMSESHDAGCRCYVWIDGALTTWPNVPDRYKPKSMRAA